MVQAERDLPEQSPQTERFKLGGLTIGTNKPDKFIANQQYEQWEIKTKRGNLLKASDIKDRTGIDRRYRARSYESVIDMGVKAARAAGDLENIYAVFVSTSYPIGNGKNASYEVSCNLGLQPKFHSDIHFACSGFVYWLTYMKQYEEEFRGKKVLFVATEKYSPTLAYLTKEGIETDPSMARLIFSDQAAACILEANNDLQVLGFENRTIKLSEKFENCIRMPIDPSLMVKPFLAIPIPYPESGKFEQYGQKVLRGLTEIPKLNLEVVENAGLQASDIKLVIPHQSSLPMIKLLSEQMPGYTIMNDLQDGNSSSASILIALARAIKEGRVQRGDQILLSAFGAGTDLFASSAVVRVGTS